MQNFSGKSSNAFRHTKMTFRVQELAFSPSSRSVQRPRCSKPCMFSVLRSILALWIDYKYFYRTKARQILKSTSSGTGVTFAWFSILEVRKEDKILIILSSLQYTLSVSTWSCRPTTRPMLKRVFPLHKLCWISLRSPAIYETGFRQYNSRFISKLNLSDRIFLKVPMHRNFWYFFIGLYERRLKTKKKTFYRLLISASVPEIWPFKVSEILRKKAKRKLNILCPFNRNCDVKTRICIYSIFKSHVIQTFLVRIK